MKSENRSSIKVKVILGYILVFLAIIASMLIAYQAYNKLLDSVVFLSKPDSEIARMNRVLTNLSEAENKIRIYSLTKKERYLAHYAENIVEIQANLDSLRTYSADSSKSFFLIDSMYVLLEERADKLERFVRLKRAKEKENLSQIAMQQLSNASDSAKTKIKTTTTTTTFLDTLITPTEKKEKRRGFWAKLFSNKKDTVKIDSIETVVKRTEIQVDTSYLPQSDSLLRSLENMLLIAQAKEQLNREIVSKEELRLVEENSIMWDKIKVLLRQLEDERLVQLTKESDKAKQIANNSIFVISVIIIVGFVLGILFIIFILTDLTKSNYYKSELIIAKGKAEKLAKVKEDFLATMSHEIRTPLNAIIGFTNQLSKTSLIGNQRSFVDILKSSSKHLLGLVNEILDLSKIEAGKLNIERINFNPKSLVTEVYDLLKVNADKRNLAFTIDFSGEENINLKSDPFRIKQILLNMGSNAIKFTEKGFVKIVASVIPHEDLYLFEVNVEDTGIGIANDQLNTIFEDFSQADTFSARKYGGTGLGLAISRRLSILLGGDLFVHSELGKGSCFTLRIPLSQASEIAVEESFQDSSDLLSILRGKQFLIVDDDDYSLLLLKTIFSGWELKADFVEDGEKAWSLIQEQKYDMVLTDIHMPKMGGIELCRKIRTLEDYEQANIPIVALTANVRDSDLKEYIASGMTECLVKPFNEKILNSMLTELLLKQPKSVTNKILDTDIDENEDLYDLSQIEQFTADDPDLFKQILNQFVFSTEESLYEIRLACDKSDYLEVGSIAHKMLGSFTQLKVVNLIPLLKELEDLLHKKSGTVDDPDYILELVEELEQNSKIVISSIHNEMSEL
nr:response regulator [uncultured Marinifilum sp.]